MCIFSVHNVIKDAPFSQARPGLLPQPADLSGRDAAETASSRCSISPCGIGGYLFLGPSENVTQHPKLFTTVDGKLRHLQGARGGCAGARPSISRSASSIYRSRAASRTGRRDLAADGPGQR